MGTYEQMGYFSDTFVDGCNDFGDSLIFSCCYSSPFNNKYTVMDAFPTAGALLEWFCKNILRDPSADIGKLIADAKLDGTGSLMMLPYVENFHGAVVGMSLSTTTDEIFAAILESLAYQFVACVDYIRSTRKQPFTKPAFRRRWFPYRQTSAAAGRSDPGSARKNAEHRASVAWRLYAGWSRKQLVCQRGRRGRPYGQSRFLLRADSGKRNKICRTVCEIQGNFR
ncbi:MAG: hypothetical protein ACLRXP_09140 [Oscillospiraceae bacterium]